MPKSLSHVVMFTDDLDSLVRFLTEIAGITVVAPYEAKADDIRNLFDWPVTKGVRGAFVGEGPGALDLLEIPEDLRGTVAPGVRLLAIVNRDCAAAGEAAATTGYATRGPFHTTAATDAPMALVEVIAGGIPFELVQFG